jgi:hypothetical protein
MTTTVTTQAELDNALADKADQIDIRSDAGVWLQINQTGSSRVVARGSSSVVAWDSSSVEARDSSRVEARDSSRVEAGKYVAVHLHSTRVTVDGGVVIDLTQLDMTDPTTWLDFHGVALTDGAAVLYKAVDADLRAGQGYISAAYPIGETVTARDWEASRGHGLHFGVSPAHARRYFNGTGAPRFLEVAVPVEDLVGLDGKCKARSCTVVREVDMHGDPVETATEVTE